MKFGRTFIFGQFLNLIGVIFLMGGMFVLYVALCNVIATGWKDQFVPDVAKTFFLMGIGVFVITGNILRAIEEAKLTTQ